MTLTLHNPPRCPRHPGRIFLTEHVCGARNHDGTICTYSNRRPEPETYAQPCIESRPGQMSIDSMAQLEMKVS